MNRILILIISIFIILFYQVIKLNANDDTYINSSNITYNEKENFVELAENSKINFKNINILIDKGIIDYNKNEFEVFGNFYLYEDLTILSGKNLKGNTSLDEFTAANVSYIYNDDLKIDSDNMNRENNLVYFYNNFLTPCELEGYFNCPTWSLRIDKTEYDIEEDKFKHFDTFLQIADYKVFYLPYFSHYGVKAPRKRGFLTPTIEFTIGGDQGVIAPYYIPLNQSNDILVKPKIFFDQNFQFLEKYQVETLIQNKRSGGDTSVLINNLKNQGSNNINTSINIKTKQVLSKDQVLSASGLFTNSISTTRSINDEPIAFEDLYLKLENYDLFINNDYLKTELSSVETFKSNNLNAIPISPSVNYSNIFNNNKFTLINDIDFAILKRNNSELDKPSESFKLKINNELINNSYIENLNVYNKIFLNNSYNNYQFNNQKNLDHNSIKSNLSLSSDLFYNKFGNVKPRVKFIIPIQLINSDKKINEESNSITFNYQNQYSENRFFGYDLYDTSPRIIYGFENEIYKNSQKINFNINQSFESNINSPYSDEVNQNSKFSDYALEFKYELNDFFFQLDTRLDQNNLSKKEMNYSVSFSNPIELTLNYNETQSEAFKNLSRDTQSIKSSISKKVNDHIYLGYVSDYDVKNNYDPYKTSFRISIFDECSQLDIDYTNTRFNDNYNTTPEETISFTFSMDYLGFFGYQQTTDLFFTEPGNVNYGL